MLLNLEILKKIEAVKHGIASLPYPIVPTKGLTINGAIYSSQLFIYGQAIGWNNLPDYIYNLFCKRREELNAIIVHTDATTEFLITLNARLKNEENRINNFINSLIEIYQLNQLETIVDDFSYGGIVAQFLTPKDFSRLPRKEGVAKWSMYEFEVPIENWIPKRKAFYENPIIEINNTFLDTLPLSLRSEEISFLFFYLGNNGLLALQDMLNIDKILISFPFLCRLQRC